MRERRKQQRIRQSSSQQQSTNSPIHPLTDRLKEVRQTGQTFCILFDKFSLFRLLQIAVKEGNKPSS